MHTWILTSQNDLWFFLWMYKLNYILWCMMLIIIYIFYIIHNIQLSYDYNYVNLITCLHHVAKLHMLNVKWWTLIFHIHYNNRGLFCDPNIIANNKERSFQKPAVANHNSLQTLKLLWYHNIRTRTIATPELDTIAKLFDYNCFYTLFAINITSETICNTPITAKT